MKAATTLDLLCTIPNISSEVLEEIRFEKRFYENIEEFSHLVRRIELDLFWDSSLRRGLPRYWNLFWSFVAVLWRVCRKLITFVNLETIYVRWVVQRPPKHKIPVLLRPLKVLRRARPDISIHLDTNSSLSSRELAQMQRNSGDRGIDRSRELIENAIDDVGDRWAAHLDTVVHPP